MFFAALISASLIVFATAENFFIPFKLTSISNLGLCAGPIFFFKTYLGKFNPFF